MASSSKHGPGWGRAAGQRPLSALYEARPVWLTRSLGTWEPGGQVRTRVLDQILQASLSLRPGPAVWHPRMAEMSSAGSSFNPPMSGCRPSLCSVFLCRLCCLYIPCYNLSGPKTYPKDAVKKSEHKKKKKKASTLEFQGCYEALSRELHLYKNGGWYPSKETVRNRVEGYGLWRLTAIDSSPTHCIDCLVTLGFSEPQFPLLQNRGEMLCLRGMCGSEEGGTHVGLQQRRRRDPHGSVTRAGSVRCE